MSRATIDQLQSLISQLHADRQAHVNAIEQIDKAFASLGISPGAKPHRRRGRPPKAASIGVSAPVAVKHRRRGRRKFAVSGTQSILNFVRQSGAKGATGGEIAKRWKSEGRAAGCYNILGQLVKNRKIRRKKLLGQKGSMYVAA